MTVQEFSPEGVAGDSDDIINKPEDYLFYRSHLSGPGGAHFELLIEEQHGKKQIAEAKAWLKANRDVLSIHTIKGTV